MDPLTVVLHDSEDPFSAKTVQLLCDWSAAGWIQGYVLVSVAEVLERGAALAQDRVVVPPTLTNPRTVRTLGRLAEGRALRIVVLDPVGRDATWLAARVRRHEAAALLFGRASSRIGAIDAVIPWHGGHWDPHLVPWPGWDTLVAAPQEAGSPTEGGFDLYCDPDDPAQVLAVAAHAAAFIAAVAALWVGVEASPWDQTDDVDDARLARTFHIRLDGSEVRALLREAALAPTSLRAPDAIAGSGTGSFSARVASLHKKLQLEPRPPSQPAPQTQGVGAWQATMMLLRFLWHSLVMAPSELSATLLGRVRSTSATRLTAVIFGSASSKHVTVTGVRGATRSAAAVRQASASEQRLSEILANLAMLDPRLAPASPPSSQDSFWRATIHTTLALVSGERQHDVDPVNDEGVNRWYPADLVAPASALTWHPMDGLSVPGVGDDVPVHDVLACSDALAELESMESMEGYRRDEVARNRRDLARMSTQWQQSFLGRVGTMLSSEIEGFRALLTDRLDRLHGLSDPPTEEVDDLAGRLSRITRIATLAALVVGLVLALLDATNVVTRPVWVWLPLLVIAWFCVLVVGYLSVQRRIFQLLHRAEEKETEIRELEREIPSLVENLRRLRRVYDQYLVWARLLPLYLREPLGRTTEAASQSTRMAGEVPASVVSGRFTVRDPRDARRQMTLLVREVRTPASEAWSRFVEASVQALAQERPDFASLTKEDVYGLEDQRLERWLAVASSPEPSAEMAEDLAEALGRMQTQAILDRSHPGRVRGLIDESFDVLTAEGRLVPGPASGDRPAPFRKEAFSPDGLAKDLTAPDLSIRRDKGVDSRPAGPRRALDEVSSVLVATRLLMMSDLSLQSAESRLPVGEPRPVVDPDRVVF